MPSGRTHDRITLWTMPWLAGGTFFLTQNPLQVLLVTGAYLFGGLMLSPDLDIHSRPYKRWGPFRWIWLPYRRVLHHRSMLSHGPIIGTVFRLAYLGAWLLLFWVIWVVSIAQLVEPEAWRELSRSQIEGTIQSLRNTLESNPTEALILFLGLELGGMSHAMSDWGSSAWKRFRRKRLKSRAKRQSQAKRRRKS